MPSSDASTPITNVSASTERSTWPREAPSVRSSANSFVRCATVTLKVLKIRKRADEQRHAGEHEQRRADEAERVREVLRLLLGLLLARAHGELRAPARAAIAALSCSGVVPPAAATEMSS